MVAHVMIQLKPEDLPDQGIKVRYRCGELFDKKLEWGELSEGILQAEAATNDLQEPGINIKDLGVPGYAGFEHRTGNYWRYLHESDPEVFREQCMQVVEIQQPFSPRSAIKSWLPIADTLSADRLRVSLKNEVTGAELSYKVMGRGFGYQIKDLNNGRRTQKILKHDYILNQMLGTSFKKLDHHKSSVSTWSHGEDKVGGGLEIFFERECFTLRYEITEQSFSLRLFNSDKTNPELIKQVELSHSDVIEDTRIFLG